MLKTKAGKEFQESLKNLSNYSFGGVSPMKILKTSKSLV